MSTVSSGDTAWVLVSAALVTLMVPGLAFFYGGLVRQKSALNTMLISEGIYLSEHLGREVTPEDVLANSHATARPI